MHNRDANWCNFKSSKAVTGRLTLSLVSSVGLLLLTACGGSNSQGEPIGASTAQTSAPSETVSASTTTGPGTYIFEYEGATGSILVPTPPTDPRLAEFESYRKVAGGGPATYFIVEVDNRNGSENLNMYQAVITTDTGAQFEADNIGDLIDEWREAFSIDTPEGRENYNVGVDLNNENMFYLRPGAKGTAILAIDGELEGSPARVYVSPAGAMSEVEATKVD